jgi:hypothetical protein
MEVDADATTPNFIATPRGRFSKGSYVNHRPFISQVFFLSLSQKYRYVDSEWPVIAFAKEASLIRSGCIRRCSFSMRCCLDAKEEKHDLSLTARFLVGWLYKERAVCSVLIL